MFGSSLITFLKRLKQDYKNLVTYFIWANPKSYNDLKKNYGVFFESIAQDHLWFKILSITFFLTFFLIIGLISVYITSNKQIPTLKTGNFNEIKYIVEKYPKVDLYNLNPKGFYSQILKYGLNKKILTYMEKKGIGINKQVGNFTRFEHYIISYRPAYRNSSTAGQFFLFLDYKPLIENYKQWKETYPKINFESVADRICQTKGEACFNLSLINYTLGKKSELEGILDNLCQEKNADQCRVVDHGTSILLVFSS